MAQRVTTTLVCDLHDDDTAGTQTITFSLDGVNYELDVCDVHAGTMREDLARYVGVARRSGGRRGSTRGPRRASAGSDRQQSAQVREWARRQGIPVSERGRIPASLLERYQAAH